VANLLVFVNAHLAANYTNKVAVIASHCDRARWLYPSPPEQSSQHERQPQSQDLSESTKRLKLNGSQALKLNVKPAPASTGNKYRPFRLVEEEFLRNLTELLSTTTPEAVASTTSTMIAGALTLALSYSNRESIIYAESLIGSSAANVPDTTSSADAGAGTSALQSRILLVSASPSTDLAHQYIPIMNAIFACQRLSIPIDILQLPIASQKDNISNSTVFLQQAADATHGIFIPAELSPSPSRSSQAFLTYLLLALLPSPTTRSRHLILPTRIDVDFRAACFCHRNVVSVGFVCSICLSIFCAVPDNGDCLTCGTHLNVGRYGARPVVVARKTKKKQAAAAR
jgi:transcription initiation factor TFIIH subunit 3